MARAPGPKDSSEIRGQTLNDVRRGNRAPVDKGQGTIVRGWAQNTPYVEGSITASKPAFRLTVIAAKLAKLTDGRRLRNLGMRLPTFGEPRRLAPYTGPDLVVIDATAREDIASIEKPGLYLLEGLQPEKV